MKQDLLNIKELVSKTLAEMPVTRDSDTELMLAVWQQQGLVLTDDQVRLFRTTLAKAESISRARRAFQETGLYEASPDVRAAREKERQEMEAMTAQMKQVICLHEKVYVDDDGGRYCVACKQLVYKIDTPLW